MAESTDPLREQVARLLLDAPNVKTQIGDVTALALADTLLPLFASRERAAAEKGWVEGFEVGTDAGGRWFENGGRDNDDVNPYVESKNLSPLTFGPSPAEALTVRAQLEGDGA